jgi:hypothetical protein
MPVLDFQLSSTQVNAKFTELMPLADQYLGIRRTLAREFSSFTDAQKQAVVQKASVVTGDDIEQPIPGVDKHDPNNQKFVQNLVIIRETNPLLYKQLMSWD